MNITHHAKAWVGTDRNSENKAMHSLMSAWKEKLSNIEDGTDINQVESVNGKVTIKAPIVAYQKDTSQDNEYLSMIFLSEDDKKHFGVTTKGINFKKIPESKFYGNVIATTQDGFEIDLKYQQDPGESDKLMLWGKVVTIEFY